MVGPDKDAPMTVDGTTQEADIHRSPLFAAVKERLSKSIESEPQASRSQEDFASASATVPSASASASTSASASISADGLLRRVTIDPSADLRHQPQQATLEGKASPQESVKALIDNWHRLLEIATQEDNDLADQNLDLELITFLLDHRYSTPPGKELINLLEAQFRGWREVEGQLRSFKNFMRSHGAKLVGVNELPSEFTRLVPEKPPVFNIKNEFAGGPTAQSQRTPFSTKKLAAV
jgi:hypothetical protein